MKHFLLFIVFLTFSFGSAIGQTKIFIKYPDSLKTSKLFFSPYSKYSYIPSIIGILRIGDNYDSLLNYQHSDFENIESDDSLGTLISKQRGLSIIIDTAREIDLSGYFAKSR